MGLGVFVVGTALSLRFFVVSVCLSRLTFRTCPCDNLRRAYQKIQFNYKMVYVSVNHRNFALEKLWMYEGCYMQLYMHIRCGLRGLIINL